MPQNRTTQAKFLDLATKAAARSGIEMVVDYKYANEGRASFQQEGSLRSLLIVEFHFQDGSATLEAHPVVEGMPEYCDSNEKLQVALERLEAWLERKALGLPEATPIGEGRATGG